MSPLVPQNLTRYHSNSRRGGHFLHKALGKRTTSLFILIRTSLIHRSYLFKTEKQDGFDSQLIHGENRPLQRSWQVDRLGLIKRERTLSEMMELGIRPHLSELSLSDTISELEKFGIGRSWKAVHK